MDISVITPTFNRAASLERALDSVLAQSLAPKEHVIADNLSTDGTQQIIERYIQRAPFPVIYLREKDTGMYQALNRGIERATAQACYFLNDDDQIFDARVLEIMAACLTATDADLVYGDVLLFDPATGREQLRRHNQVNKMTLVHKGINQPAMLYRSSVFKTCGRFDEGYRIASDHEWLLRAFVKHDIRATYLKMPLARFALGGLSGDERLAAKRREERQRATAAWYTPEAVKLSTTYRKYVRKIPFGTALFNWIHPLQLRIQTVNYRAGRFEPDLAARLGF
jgi:glycosyltransferase involved in cell wall biosynthesis